MLKGEQQQFYSWTIAIYFKIVRSQVSASPWGRRVKNCILDHHSLLWKFVHVFCTPQRPTAAPRGGRGVRPKLPQHPFACHFFSVCWEYNRPSFPGLGPLLSYQQWMHGSIVARRQGRQPMCNSVTLFAAPKNRSTFIAGGFHVGTTVSNKLHCTKLDRKYKCNPRSNNCLHVFDVWKRLSSYVDITSKPWSLKKNRFIFIMSMKNRQFTIPYPMSLFLLLSWYL